MQPKHLEYLGDKKKKQKEEVIIVVLVHTQQLRTTRATTTKIDKIENKHAGHRHIRQLVAEPHHSENNIAAKLFQSGMTATSAFFTN